jgi:hypothetical protein
VLPVLVDRMLVVCRMRVFLRHRLPMSAVIGMRGVIDRRLRGRPA